MLENFYAGGVYEIKQHILWGGAAAEKSAHRTQGGEKITSEVSGAVGGGGGGGGRAEVEGRAAGKRRDWLPRRCVLGSR